MESYGTIYFSNENSELELVNLAKGIAEGDFGLGIESEETTNGISVIEVIGGSRTEDGVKSILTALNDKKVQVVKAYIIGDEGPWCRLYSIDDSNLSSVECSDGIYEYLSECEEEEIEDIPELKIALEKKPRGYFEPKFNTWALGLESADTNAIKGVMEAIIESSEDLVQ
ncbi:hypothetical protein EXT46_05750 [Pseudoalteromonas sp. CO325X]|uniref:hypothetical protein n=1 Tax=Pseudoalteromonas sp. CO325X TaxID=1777262 RepID=UPI001022F215|nr:hypothetical protein [Pseudoalteromonas sp. CO325X]RZF82955.1 hypothetical protein EXT46_05750 [Pseudoalteromonas sp. CO325X]